MSNREQLSLTVRYVFNGPVKEIFLDFVEVDRITGESLGEAILHWLHAHGLPASDMRGQCYDGASNMSGARSGCQAIVKQKAPKAIYFHCSAHRLNLAVVSACTIPAFKNAESYLGEIARFFGYSAKRQRLLDTAVDNISTPNKAKKLKDACRTRWIQRIDSYAVFEELLPAVRTTLEAMVYPRNFQELLGNNWNWDGETVTKANGFLFQLESSSFLIAFKILLKIFSYLREITLKLQMEAIDAAYAYKQVHSVVSTLKDMRNESTEGFKKIFADTTKLGKDLHGVQFELQKPRVVGRQAHRSNPNVSTVEDYFRITPYDEFLSHVIAELEERFLDNQTQDVALGLLDLLPHECIKHDDLPEHLNHIVEYYSDDLPHPLLFSTEYEMWIQKWKQCSDMSEVSNKLVDALQVCSPFQFPNMSVLLHIALTLPISSCEAERSFSQLKLIKTSLRSTMSGHRLSGLALMKINRYLCEKLSSPGNMRKLVETFMQLHPRRMKLPFVLAD